MVDFLDLPSEIWHLIAQYISRDKLCNLKYLNSFFLNYWMDYRWGKCSIEVNSLHTSPLYRFAREVKCVNEEVFFDFSSEYLSRVPFVASRMRVLFVVLDTSMLEGSIWHYTNFYCGLGQILSSLTLLPNLISLGIDNATSHLADFFKKITASSLTNTLQRLSLTGRVEMFASIQEYFNHKSPFDNLIKLTVELHAADDEKGSELESSLTLEPFLRSLAPTLQSLVIINKSLTLDLSPLFNVLSNHDSPVLFPKLTSLFLDLPFVTSLRTSPKSLLHFLRTNNQLHSLHLNLSLHPKDHDDDNDGPLGAWLAEFVNDEVYFPSLQTLGMYCNTKTCVSGLLSLIKLTLPTLSSLAVSGLYLKLGLVDTLVTALTERGGQSKTLKSLVLNVTELSIPLLELLARKLPQLENLVLAVLQTTDDSFHDLLQKRRYDRDRDGTSSQDVLHAWKLRDLKIYTDWGWDDNDLDGKAIRSVAGTIRTLSHLSQVRDLNEFDHF